MKTCTKNAIRYILFGVGLLLMSIFYQIALAHEDANPKTEIPTTADAVWKSIDQHVNDVDQLIKTDKLTEVHLHAAAIHDLANALPALSANLSADKLKQVQTNLKFIDTLTKRLDESGDSNDKPATIANLTKLKKSLDMMRINYPMENVVKQN